MAHGQNHKIWPYYTCKARHYEFLSWELQAKKHVKHAIYCFVSITTEEQYTRKLCWSGMYTESKANNSATISLNIYMIAKKYIINTVRIIKLYTVTCHNTDHEYEL